MSKRYTTSRNTIEAWAANHNMAFVFSAGQVHLTGKADDNLYMTMHGEDLGYNVAFQDPCVSFSDGNGGFPRADTVELCKMSDRIMRDLSRFSSVTG